MRWAEWFYFFVAPHPWLAAWRNVRIEVGWWKQARAFMKAYEAREECDCQDENCERKKTLEDILILRRNAFLGLWHNILAVIIGFAFWLYLILFDPLWFN